MKHVCLCTTPSLYEDMDPNNCFYLSPTRNESRYCSYGKYIVILNRFPGRQEKQKKRLCVCERLSWASYHIHKFAGCACGGDAGIQRKPLVSDPGMHHGTYVTHAPWCMSWSLTRSGGDIRSRHSRRMSNPQFYISGKMPIRCQNIIHV